MNCYYYNVILINRDNHIVVSLIKIFAVDFQDISDLAI
jgi:hypothetical protein